MKRVVCHIFLLFLLLVTGSTVLWAEEQLPQKLQKLTDEAYRCYSARETENFFESIKRVKDATEFSDYQETYYRACSYEAIYMFEYVDRQKGVELSHAIYHHAKDNKCLARYNQGDSLGFEEAYKERAQLIAEHGGQGGLFGELINVYQAKNRKQWALALKRTDKLIHQQNRCAQKATIYEQMGDLKQALYWQKKAREVIDSIQSSEARLQMNEFDAELSLTYAENDAKEQIEGEEVDDMHGKTLFVYTDGINEAENIHKEQFGDDRLKALLQQDWGDARQTSEQIHKAVEDFVGGAEPSDDLTKMCIKMK